jgi:hypothetical protein
MCYNRVAMAKRFLLFALMLLSTRGLTAHSVLTLVDTWISLRQIDLSPALYHDTNGYPRLDFAKLPADQRQIIARDHRAYVLENEFLRLTLLPEMGRVYSLVNKLTGHEQFWTNAVAKPIGANNDTGWWMVWGGIEYTLPRGEHGTTWALPWSHEIVENSPERKAVRMSVIEPVTRIEQRLTISLRPRQVFFETEILLRNSGVAPALYSHWMNPMWAPGGRGELTPETELIVPCTAMIVLDRNFNQWMLGERVQEFEYNPLRFVKHWRSMGDLLAERLTAGFYSAFSHEANEGVVRVFDPRKTPGMDIWTWGFPPAPQHQQEFSQLPNLGYVEMWGGTARDYSDEARQVLRPSETRWKEWIYSYNGIEGLTHADREFAVNFLVHSNRVHLGIFATRDLDGVDLRLRHGTNEVLAARLGLRPERPFVFGLTNQFDNGPVPMLSLKSRGRPALHLSAKPVRPLSFGHPYLPAPARD